jgi:predicted CoA-binding protein
MPLTRDADIANVLASVRTIAVVGASNKPERPSYRVMQYLFDEGYQVLPVNPGLAGQQILGCTVVDTLEAVTSSIDMVEVFRQSRFLPEIFQQAIALGIGTVWTQLGVVDHAAARAAEDSGIAVVMDRCPAIEGPRLRAMGLL